MASLPIPAHKVKKLKQERKQNHKKAGWTGTRGLNAKVRKRNLPSSKILIPERNWFSP